MEKFIDIKQASELLGVKTGTLYFWKFKHLIPCYKLNTGRKGRVLFKASELVDFVNQGKIEPDGKDI
jgi:DNA-binding transcriptional MerR regulator